MVQMGKGQRLMGGAKPPQSQRREPMISVEQRQPQRQQGRGGGAYPVPIPVRPRPQMPQMPGGGMMPPNIAQPRPGVPPTLPPPGMGQGGMQPGFQTGMMPPQGGPPNIAQPMPGGMPPGFPQGGMMPPSMREPTLPFQMMPGGGLPANTMYPGQPAGMTTDQVRNDPNAQPRSMQPGGNDIMSMIMALAQGRGRRGF